MCHLVSNSIWEEELRLEDILGRIGYFFRRLTVDPPNFYNKSQSFLKLKFPLMILFCFHWYHWMQRVTHILNSVWFFNNSLETIVTDIRNNKIIGRSAGYQRLDIRIQFFKLLDSLFSALVSKNGKVGINGGVAKIGGNLNRRAIRRLSESPLDNKWLQAPQVPGHNIGNLI